MGQEHFTVYDETDNHEEKYVMNYVIKYLFKSDSHRIKELSLALTENTLNNAIPNVCGGIELK